MNALLLTLLAVTSWAAPKLSGDGRSRVEAGEVVVELADDGRFVAAVDVAAPAQKVMAALLDFDRRVSESSSLRRHAIYEQEPGKVGVRFEASTAGIRGVWHTIYRVDAARTRCDYALDPDRRHTLTRMEGVYELVERGPVTRVVATLRTETGYPDWIVRPASRASLRQMLENVRADATRP